MIDDPANTVKYMRVLFALMNGNHQVELKDLYNISKALNRTGIPVKDEGLTLHYFHESVLTTLIKLKIGEIENQRSSDHMKRLEKCLDNFMNTAELEEATLADPGIYREENPMTWNT